MNGNYWSETFERQCLQRLKVISLSDVQSQFLGNFTEECFCPPVTDKAWRSLGPFIQVKSRTHRSRLILDCNNQWKQLHNVLLLMIRRRNFCSSIPMFSYALEHHSDLWQLKNRRHYCHQQFRRLQCRQLCRRYQYQWSCQRWSWTNSLAIHWNGLNGVVSLVRPLINLG